MSVPSSIPPHGPAAVPPFAAALDTLAQLLPPRLLAPRVGIVCGSGLSTLAKSLRDVVEVPYEQLAGFGASTVQGHRSALAFGVIGEGAGVPVVAMLGRFHPYEGHPLATVVYPIRLLSKLGVKELIITNASGALNEAYDVGSIVLIADHLAIPNLAGPLNALFGPPLSPDHPRFVPLSDAYSRRVRKAVVRAAHELGAQGAFGPVPPGAPQPWIPLHEGTYAYVAGPTYETPAEGRFLRAAGADVVGMSTVPEVLAAREAGVEVVVLSLVTNKVVVGSKEGGWVAGEVADEILGREVPAKVQETVSHEEVLQVGREKAEVMRRLVERVVERLDQAAKA